MSTPRFPMGVYWWLLALIVLIAVLPLVTTLLAVGVASANGCTLNEGVLTPCIIGGTDYGALPQFGGISVFYFLLTVPVAFVLFLVWVTVLILHRTVFRRRVAA